MPIRTNHPLFSRIQVRGRFIPLGFVFENNPVQTREGYAVGALEELMSDLDRRWPEEGSRTECRATSSPSSARSEDGNHERRSTVLSHCIHVQRRGRSKAGLI
ncbi:hypothetical protein NL676_030406 [Syzygium grande]|nr:hypothetical protein NL676_030406 [Syzygium grande]